MEWPALRDEGWAPLAAFLTSLAIGLLIGVERERSPAAKAGVRRPIAREAGYPPGGSIGGRGPSGAALVVAERCVTTKIRIEWPRGAVTAVLEPTPTAARLVAALPFTARAETWGEEVYFTTPVRAQLESSAKQVVPPGTVCFWVDGDALALPYGPTPISKQGESRLVTRCNVLGQIVGDARALAGVRAGDSIKVTKEN